ncbi:carbamoyltransferase family protein [Palleronia caenipelagi]|nr:carbamoyltransferase C-terminal domain-containing protein [Palleronia caenipelagi]
MTYTLGLATMDNSAAALFHDGRLIAAVEQERLSRIKNDGALPFLAIEECLTMAGITASQIDRIAVYWQPWRVASRGVQTLRKMAGSSNARSAILGRLRHIMGQGDAEEDPRSSWSDLFRLRKHLTGHFGPLNARISYHDHHLCHQLYAEQMRDWDEFVSLSYDGGGETNSTVLSTVRGGRRETVSRHRWPNSLGHYYSFFTGFLGFTMLEGEYKMMGLAPYGTPRYADALKAHALHLEPGGRYRLNTALCDYHAALKGHFPAEAEELFGPRRQPDADPSPEHVDLATSVQQVHEDALIHLFEPLRERAPELRKLVISGGCALNVTANGRLLADGIFDEIIIPPAPHDAGCAIGAGLADLAARSVSPETETVRSPYLGAAYDRSRIEAAMTAAGVTPPPPRSDADLARDTAQALADGLVVAWFQGRSEFGPRALGARSFLADPRRDAVREELNQKIKKRELFRPFAPSVAEEAASRFFEIDQPSPYMNIVAKVRPEMASVIPAVTHVDGTARVHTVSPEANPIYHALLTAFGDLTGVPVLLNTSFNIQEPIVHTPEDALATFRASGVDVLALGPYLIRRADLS